ncbi:pentapeptide repeat-containing protein [Actinoplanes sp. NPDC049548]|uniref:pentapeptide repeat-containing protein n=1 Tax=Actinoplanes sp. NPDC049548 TaxID=3155152 RepID=UPI0034425810
MRTLRWPWFLSDRGVLALACTVFGIGILALVAMLLIAADVTGDERAKLQIEAIKYGLGFFAASGAAAALLLAVRRQRLSEHTHELELLKHAHTEADATERRVTDLYTKAAEQLGSADAAVRLAGLYALERVAQNNAGQRQTIVNVLCAYLRMPYTPPMPPARAADASPPGLPLPGPGLVTADARLARQELQVRMTAQRILSTHLRLPADVEPHQAALLRPDPHQPFWPGMDVDLTGAALVNWDGDQGHVRRAGFGSVTFHGTASFAAATFTGAADFAGARFSGDARFPEAVFTDQATFGHVSVAGFADFNQAAFADDVSFRDATFHGVADFTDATFSQGAWFRTAAFHVNVEFRAASFHLEADFRGATFRDNAGFREVVFAAKADFDRARFSGIGWFSGAQFGGTAWFRKTRFSDVVSFDRACFGADARFRRADFAGDATFRAVTFDGTAEFSGVSFSAEATFDGAAFAAGAWFGEGNFGGGISFRTATFADVAWFNDAIFSGDAGFDQATFASDSSLEHARVLARDGRHDTWPPGWVYMPAADFGRLLSVPAAARSAGRPERQG